MSELNKKISELDSRNELNGGEYIPFEHNSINGKISVNSIKQFATQLITERLSQLENNPEVISFANTTNTTPTVQNTTANVYGSDPSISIIYVASLCKFVGKRGTTYYADWMDSHKYNPLRKGVVYIDTSDLCLYIYNGYTLQKTSDDYDTEIGQIHLDINQLSGRLTTETDSLNDLIGTVSESLSESLMDTRTELEEYTDGKISQVNQSIAAIENDLNLLVNGNVAQTIDSFNEIIDFLDGITDNEKLSTKLATISSNISDEISQRTNKDMELEATVNQKGIVWNDRLDVKEGAVVSYNNVLYRAVTDIGVGGDNPYNNNDYVRLTQSGYLMMTETEYESKKTNNQLDENILYLIEEEE